MRRVPAVSAAMILTLAAAATARAASAGDGAAAPVQLREEEVAIPTYLLGPPEVNPDFYSGGNSQGAQHRIYPYPAYDNLTTEKTDKHYKMVYLENEYLRVGILPELGGKIFEAVDKTNGYDFFYHQHVIKPALISLLGAWISGGVEWDIPHHHRATSFLPVQYSTEKAADGSATVWVGELELRDRTRWAVGVTLHPGKSYIEASFRMINRTPLPVSMLCFSNVAVSVNDNYQVIFPPSTQHVTYHGKNQFTTWPIATGRFNNTDFGAGTDASWYKNHYNSMSMFAWNFTDDFLAGYDHGKQAGTMAIADHNVVPGKKFWTWGNGPGGRAQDTLLTDNDGPYIELMVGAYSDNQPDYSWLAPFETRQWTQYWYPFRDIDGAKNANIDAAVNLDVKEGKAKLGFCVTSQRPGATVLLTLKGQPLLKETADLSPDKPWMKEVALPPGTDEHDLRASLVADGRELIAYSPITLQPEALPPPVTPFPAPDQIKTNEELYLAGLRNDQFRAPGLNPGAQADPAIPPANERWDPYWEEALKRDPGDIRVNTAMGIECIRGGRFQDAEKYLRAAVTRATDRYTTPKDAEPLYYLALALKMQNKLDEAFPLFSKATWSAAWKGPAYLEMAQIASIRGDSASALAYLTQSLQFGGTNEPALELRISLLRNLHHDDEAQSAADALKSIDPLDLDGQIEQALAAIKKNQSPAADLSPIATLLNQFPQTTLELAADALDSGRQEDAWAWLGLTDVPHHALAAYYLGYMAQQLHYPDRAEFYFNLAAHAPTDYQFPFQMEMIPVLQAAMAANPTDPHAPYFLGNLLFDSQPERAIALWQKSAELNADVPVLYHNLAMVYQRQNQRDKQKAALEKAASLGGNAMVFTDLDALYEQEAVPPEKRLALFESHQPVINRDDAIAREINLKIFAGKYDDALVLLQSRFFRAWEGGGRFSLGDAWTNALLLRGQQELAARQPDKALADFTAAANFPANLQDATGGPFTRTAEAAYFTGLACEALGKPDQAKVAFTQAAGDAAASPTAPRGGRAGFPGRGLMGGIASGVRIPLTQSYYQALALEKLGQHDKATALFAALAATPPQPDPATPIADPLLRMRAADAHYLAGLGLLGQHRPADARTQFTAALTASPDHLAAHVALLQTPQ